MLKRLVCTTAFLAAAAAGGQALAQAPAAPAAGASTAPATSPQAAPPSEQSQATGVGGAASATGAAVTSGLTVKDNTGAVIGQVTDVKPGPSGKPVAVIKMGTDSFSVDTDKLAVANGAASINATQAQLKAMLHPAGANG